MKLSLATFTILTLTFGSVQASSSSSSASRHDAQLTSGVGSAARDGSGNIDWGVNRADDRTAAKDYDDDTGPFTKAEARELSEVWPKIRQADDFDDIDWKAVGLKSAPGDHDARAFMAGHWDSLKRAARFEDIDWRAAYGDRSDHH
jgi:hypothetical protein